ncbi:MAG: ExeM/NucH family extracellular endonuclease [Rubrimonas sp.]|uniref:ExeM/NucH family extracellular endonuclease n=1 Tax=Rubrimonas sp. TaxID=2036015 RepID=UPI002FDE590F
MANDLTVNFSDRFSTTGGEAAAEVVAYDGFRYFATNGAADRIDIFRAGTGLVGALDLGDLPGYAGVTSVAAKNGLVAVAIDGGDVAGVPQRGHVALFDAATLSLINYVTVGFLPDSLIFSADGSEIYVANEGEPRPNGDAPGSVSIVTFPEGFDRLAQVIDVDFAAFDGQEDALRAQGVRIFPGVAASRDLEPEYLAIDPADGAILVTLQEANTVARIDRATLEVSLLPQGTSNHAELGNGIDASDRDGEIRIANWPVQGLRMADAIATFVVDGQTYYATANEGDSRDFDESRVKDLDLDPLAFPLAGPLQEDGNLGRLQVSNIDGDVDGDGDFDQLFSFGSRSFTIYDAAGKVVFDSGDDFEQIIASIAPERFNTDEPGDPDEIENRSDAKGPEPEAIAVGEVDGRMIAVIGLERDSGLMIYDVTDPANATFVTYIDGFAAGDVSPEVVAFIPGETSPSGFAQIAVAYEVSGTTAVYDLTFTGEPVGEGEPGGGGGEPGYDLRITEIWPGNEPGDNLTADWFEITNYGTEAWISGADPILYYDDDSKDPAVADPIEGIAEIAPGQSVIVMVDAEDAVAEFVDVWGSVVDLDDVAIGWADGAGLGQGGDGVALFVGGPSAATLADFQEFPDAESDGGKSWNVLAGAFSDVGDEFGSVATDVVNDADQPAVGSPGFAIEAEVPARFTLELLHIADQEASTQAVFDAPRASAVLNALEAQDLGGDGLPDNTLRLSSGDAILPGLFFQASAAVFGQAGVADMLIQNALGLQAIAFGNHEFDFGSGFIADLIDGTFDLDGDPATEETPVAYDVAGVPAYAGTNFPYLSANLDFSTEASLAPLEIAGGQAPQGRAVTSSTVLETGGELIGVVGATTPTIGFISSPGDLLVLPEEFDGAPTPEQIDALAALIQAEVDALLAANPDMNKVILLAHMQQIAIEQELAKRLTDVDIIVAGGSNTRLLDETDRLRDGDAKQGDYPIVVENAGGTDTLVVNTDGSYKYVGRLVIDFDADGNVLADSYDPEVSGAYATDAQGVADLGAEGLIDPVVQAVVDAIGAEIASKESNVFGVSDVYLAGLRPEIRQQETNLGNLTADANLAAAKQVDPTVTVSIKNGGGIRDDIGQVIVPPGGTEAVRTPNEEIRDADGNVVKPAGGISENDVVNALRFNNELSLLTLTTEQLRAVLEYGVAASTYDADGGVDQQGRFPQVAGVEFSFDPDLPAEARILNARIVGESGETALEIVRDGATVDNGDATIRVVTLNFLAAGGDGYPFPQDEAANRVDLVAEGVRTGAATFADDFSEQDALAEYLAANFLTTPFAVEDTPLAEDTRIQNLNFREDGVFEDDGEDGGFLLQLFHVSDQEANTASVKFAPNLSAVYSKLAMEDLDGDGVAGFPDTLFLSSGDAWLPGLFYDASEAIWGLPGAADILIQNELGIQAISFGNHEFDKGTQAIAGLLAGIPPAAGFEPFDGANFPYLAGNLDLSADAALAPLVVEDGQDATDIGGEIAGSTIVETASGARIGVVSAVTPTLREISSPGAGVSVLPYDVSGSPTEADLDALAAEIQSDVDALLAANPDLDKVILLAHMQVLEIELALAERLSHIDVIVAGGSNRRLFDADDQGFDGEAGQGEYPQFRTDADGNPVAIVNTDRSYKYLGRLVIEFDENGFIVPESYDATVSGAFATDDAGVARIGAEGLADPEIEAIAAKVAAEIAAGESRFFGVTEVFLNGERQGGGLDGVRTQETNLGNLTADANLWYANELEGGGVLVSIKNGGGIRASIGTIEVPGGGGAPLRLPPQAVFDVDGALVKPEGGVSQNDIGNALAFNNGISVLSLTTAELAAVLEHIVGAYEALEVDSGMGQVGGVKFSFDPSLPPGGRVLNAGVFDADGALVARIVENGELVDNGAQTFRTVTINFLANGGSGYPFDALSNPERIDYFVDLDGDGIVDPIDPTTNPATGAATFAQDGSEQDALAEYLLAEFGADPTEADFRAFDEADTTPEFDARIQNLDFREDAVFEGVGSTQEIVLNEVLGSTTGTDSEYVELFGAPGASLAGLSVIVVESDPEPSNGEIDFRFDFAANATLGDNGFFLLANDLAEATYGVVANATIPRDSIENSAYTIALVETASLVGAAVTGAETVLDAVAVDDGDGAFFFDAPVLGPDGRFLPAGVGRIEDGVDTDAADDWEILSFDNASPPNTPTAGTFEGSGGGGGPRFALISEVQGDGDESPLVGQVVTIEAVVVGDFQNGDADESRNLGGFYVQEEDADADGSAATSEGLFVFEGGFAGPDVALGDVVRVTGTVSEFFGETQLAGITAIEVVSSGAPAPTAAAISLPAASTTLSQDGDVQPDLEAYEGMRVTFADALTIAEQFQLDRFNEIKLVAGERPRQFTQTDAPDVAGFAAHLQEVGARTITYDDGLSVQNAAISNLDGFGPVYDTASAPRMGDVIEDLSGVLSYQWAGNSASGATWRVRSTADGENVVTPANPRPALPDVGGSLKVASFNVLNFFTTIDGAGLTGPKADQDPRGADSVEEFDRQLDKLVTAILGLDADLLGLIELENDPAGDASLSALVGALNAELGVETYEFVDTGVVGGDAIKVGFIYRPGALVPTGGFAVLDSSVDPRFDSANQRPTLAQTFERVADGEAFTATISHFKSKGSSAGNPGDEDAGDGQGLSNGTRTRAAEALVDWLATDPTGSGDPDVLILGDLNAYAKEDPIAAILKGADDVAGTEDDFVNLVVEFEGEDAYGYVFDGQTGTLDYALASASLAAQVVGAAEWRINADEADALDYNLDFGRDPAIFDGGVPFRSSDHDPVLVGLELGGGVGETLTVIASGTGDASRSPMFEVFADGVSLGVQTIAEVQTWRERRADGPIWESFVFDLDEAPAESVEIVYFNDRGRQRGAEDVNLFVDAIEIGDRRFESEIDGFFERAWSVGAEFKNGPREALYWNGTLSFEDLMLVS